MTEWRRVPGFSAYEVSDDGGIRSHRRPNGMKTRINDRGYRRVSVWPDGASRPFGASLHSLILFAFKGPRPSPSHVSRHLNGNPLDNRPVNLDWGTWQENWDDAMAHGVIRIGERHPRAKLTSADVQTIRSLLGTITHESLARHFGVCKATVSHIAEGRNWKHLEKEVAQ